jgi:hypothetical protein
MGEDFERLKQRFPLLEYLQRHHWTGRPVGTGSEYVGLCPLHEETHPSFYVNPHKNLFYCHGYGRGGDLIRFLELSLHLLALSRNGTSASLAVWERWAVGPGRSIPQQVQDKRLFVGWNHLAFLSV